MFKLITKMTEYHTCLNKKLINRLWQVISSTQYCPIDDSQDRDEAIFIPYYLVVQPAQKRFICSFTSKMTSLYFQSQRLYLPIVCITWIYPYLEIRMWLNISFVLFDDLMSYLVTVISYRQILNLNSHRLLSY